MADFEELNNSDDELCSEIFIKKKRYLAKLNREALSWCKCEPGTTARGNFSDQFVC